MGGDVCVGPYVSAWVHKCLCLWSACARVRGVACGHRCTNLCVHVCEWVLCVRVSPPAPCPSGHDCSSVYLGDVCVCGRPYTHLCTRVRLCMCAGVGVTNSWQPLGWADRGEAEGIISGLRDREGRDGQAAKMN